MRQVTLALSGASFLLTGGAGTGKSFTLHAIIKAVVARCGEAAVYVTGSTGIAACHIGGVTLHSFAGIGLGKEGAPQLVDRVRQKPHALKQWRACEVLVVDEVSLPCIP